MCSLKTNHPGKTTAEEICRQLEEKKITAKTAIARLESECVYPERLAREVIFITVGGDDVVTTNAVGEWIYDRSGKTLKEVEAIMQQTEGERKREEALRDGFILDDSSLDNPLAGPPPD